MILQGKQKSMVSWKPRGKQKDFQAGGSNQSRAPVNQVEQRHRTGHWKEQWSLVTSRRVALMGVVVVGKPLNELSSTQNRGREVRWTALWISLSQGCILT